MADIVRFGLEVDSRKLERGVDRSNRKFRELDRNAERTNKRFRGLSTTAKALAGAFAAVGAARLAKDLFQVSLAAEETANKFNTVFGASARTVDRFNERFGRMAGLARTAGREMIATTGAIAQGMGFAQAASGEFAVAVTRLAGDIASFNNLPTADVQHRINAALTGERESLKRLGIVILETDVQQRALNNTGKESAKLLTQQEKATATLQLITEKAGVAVGDLARTQGSAANQARRLQAEMETMKEEIATGLMPAFAGLIGLVRDTVDGWRALLDVRVFAEKQWTTDIDAVAIRIRVLGEEAEKLNRQIDEVGIGFGRPLTIARLEAQLGDINTEIQEQIDLLAELQRLRGELPPRTETEAETDPRSALAAINTEREGFSRMIEEEMRRRQEAAEWEIAFDTRVHNQRQALIQENEDAAKAAADRLATFQEEAARNAQQAWESTTRGMRYALEDFLNSGEFNFSRLINHMIAELQRLAAAAAATRFFETLGGTFGFLGTKTPTRTPAPIPKGLIGPGSFQHGGVVPGPIGSAQLAVVHGGETITPAHQQRALVINQNIYFTPQFIDAASGDAWLRSRKGTIAEVFAEAASESEGLRRMLRGG